MDYIYYYVSFGIFRRGLLTGSFVVFEPAHPIIRKAMLEIEANSRIKFKYIEDDKKCLIIKGDGAYPGCENDQSNTLYMLSPCGYTAPLCSSEGLLLSQPILNLGQGCMVHRIILHELMHYLGFIHEHQRPDRAGFIKVNTNYMEMVRLQFFMDQSDPNKYRWKHYTFDPDSIMLYGQYTYSKDGKKVIEALDGSTWPEQKINLSRMDKKKLKEL